MVGDAKLIASVNVTSASNLADLLWHTAAGHGNSTALVDGDATVSYAELTARAAGVANHIAALGFAPGERAGVPSALHWAG